LLHFQVRVVVPIGIDCPLVEQCRAQPRIGEWKFYNGIGNGSQNLLNWRYDKFCAVSDVDGGNPAYEGDNRYANDGKNIPAYNSFEGDDAAGNSDDRYCRR
jgi:hypothetical protein